MMRNKRSVSDDERDLFESVLSDALPLKRAPRRARKPAGVKPHAPEPTAQFAQPKHTSSKRPAGIDGSTAEKLRRGLLEPQARLDLHGMSERAAHGALVTFLRSARSRNLRLVLVVTGKGISARHNAEDAFDLGLDAQQRGVLRIMAPRWIAEPGLAQLVADVREAHRRHGGAGALYVYLRKGKNTS